MCIRDSPRAPPASTINSLVRVNHVPFTPVIDDQGWYQLDLVAYGLREMDPTKEYWLEGAGHDRMHILEAPITIDLGSDPTDHPGSLGHSPGLIRVLAQMCFTRPSHRKWRDRRRSSRE